MHNTDEQSVTSYDECKSRNLRAKWWVDSDDKKEMHHLLTPLVEVNRCRRWNVFSDQGPSGQLSSLAQGMCYRRCPMQLQLTHTALWSGARSAKVWPQVHRLRRWLANAIERSRKGLSAEHTGTQRVAFSSDGEESGNFLTKLAFFFMW